MCFSNYDKFLALSGKDSDDEDYYSFLASVEIRVADFLELIILEAGIYEKYNLWLKQSNKGECKK